jgi:hypothetical protein
VGLQKAKKNQLPERILGEIQIFYIAFENCAYNHDVTFVGKPLKRSVKFTKKHMVFGRKANKNAEEAHRARVQNLRGANS